nr:hypothetical protein [Nitzschia traheaformis]
MDGPLGLKLKGLPDECLPPLIYWSILYSYIWPILALWKVCSVARAATVPAIALPAPFWTATLINSGFLIAVFRAPQGLPQYFSNTSVLEWRLRNFRYLEPNELGNFSAMYKVNKIYKIDIQ